MFVFFRALLVLAAAAVVVVSPSWGLDQASPPKTSFPVASVVVNLDLPPQERCAVLPASLLDPSAQRWHGITKNRGARDAVLPPADTCHV